MLGSKKKIEVAKAKLKKNNLPINAQNIFIVVNNGNKGIDFLLEQSKIVTNLEVKVESLQERKEKLQVVEEVLIREEESLKIEIATLREKIKNLKNKNKAKKIDLSLSMSEEFVLGHPELLEKVLEDLHISLVKGTPGG